jgi:hypothetical protein
MQFGYPFLSATSMQTQINMSFLGTRGQETRQLSQCQGMWLGKACGWARHVARQDMWPSKTCSQARHVANIDRQIRGLQQVFSPQDVIEKPSFSGRARPEHVILATYLGTVAACLGLQLENVIYIFEL